MDEHKIDDLQEMGIRSDRIMTSQEVMNAAINYKAVKDAADTDPSISAQPSLLGKIFAAIYWGLIGFGMLIVLIAVIQVLLGI